MELVFFIDVRKKDGFVASESLELERNSNIKALM
jgi:hypothetical protein